MNNMELKYRHYWFILLAVFFTLLNGILAFKYYPEYPLESRLFLAMSAGVIGFVGVCIIFFAGSAIYDRMHPDNSETNKPQKIKVLHTGRVYETLKESRQFGSVTQTKEGEYKVDYPSLFRMTHVYVNKDGEILKSKSKCDFDFMGLVVGLVLLMGMFIPVIIYGTWFVFTSKTKVKEVEDKITKILETK